MNAKNEVIKSSLSYNKAIIVIIVIAFFVYVTNFYMLLAHTAYEVFWYTIIFIFGLKVYEYFFG